MPDPTPSPSGERDDLTALLSEWGERFEEELGSAVAEECESLERSISLLAAVEAALKLADDWEAKAREIGAQISYQDTEGAVAGFKMIGVTRYQEGAKTLREAIRTALTGQEGGDAR